MSGEARCILCAGETFSRRHIPASLLREAWGPLVTSAGDGEGLRDAYLHQCHRCELQFFRPDQAGGAPFYEALSRRTSESQDSLRWEHEKALEAVCERGASSALELGCGDGEFVETLNRNGLDAQGVDVRAPERTGDGLRIVRGAIEDVEIRERFDAVCAFHVLEHLRDPAGVLRNAVEWLHPGGLLILAVPNREGIFHVLPEKQKALDLPPHHVSRWNEKCLRAIGDLFSLEELSYAKEPLSYAHYKSAVLALAASAGRPSLAERWKARAERMILTALCPALYLQERERLAGHGQLIVFRRPLAP